ncbi:MAG: hypothetical protein HKN43_14585 [Rhodothermales bacterium]|nr:hypothetical protein [Rhodothermales bacterium]
MITRILDKPLSALPFSITTEDVIKYVFCGLQLFLIVRLIELYQIESTNGLAFVTKLVLVGFLINTVLPLKFRPGFFLGLSIVCLIAVIGVAPAVWLISIALLLFGMCHLPIPMWARVALISATGVVLALLRVEWMTTSWSPLVMPILGSMFMFRLAIYLYDIRNEKTPATFWQRMAYFLMLPNIVFPFYPIVDYSTFKRTYYNQDSFDIYQKGLTWIVRGIVHLLIYRFVYYYWTPAFSQINDLGSVVQFILSAYLLYLRISGQFHLIIGIMCLFGYNLPETHNNYFFAKGFNDYWRRINIYWKDFMMKMFFYPIYMRFRKLGPVGGLVATTAVVFVFTWLLHSYQWFWLQGTFPLTVVDGAYWGILGLLVAANSVWEATRGRKASIGVKKVTLWSALKVATQTVFMFMALSLMWSFWSSQTIGDWVSAMRSTTNSPASDFLVLIGIIGGIIVLGAVGQLISASRVAVNLRKKQNAYTAGLASVLVTIILIGLAHPRTAPRLDHEIQNVVGALRVERLNERDDELLVRGYYEGLLQTGKYTSQLWKRQEGKPPDWGAGVETVGVGRRTGDMYKVELLPNIEANFKRARLSTNSYKMRDKEYALEKPDNTLRMALLGSSLEMGWGVTNDEVFEAVVEKRLNDESIAAGSPTRYELLNYAVGGHTLSQYIFAVDNRVEQFSPDVLVVFGHASEGRRAITGILELLKERVPLPDEIQAFVDQAGVTRNMPWPESKSRLEPFKRDILLWGYRYMVRRAQEMGATPVYCFVPVTNRNGTPDEVEELFSIAQEAGIDVHLNLHGSYGDHTQSELWLGSWDDHPNALGHGLLADRFYSELQKYANQIGIEPAIQATD